MDRDLEQAFTEFSASKLEQLADRIVTCLGKLSYEQIWARGSENENAVGNLVLHLCGNLRQWIGTGVAGKPDVRVRDREFRARGDVQADELRERLEGTVADAVAIIRGLTATQLAELTTVQDYSVTKLEAVYHAVEHFAQHAGQIMFFTKMATSEDLGFYRHLSSGIGHGETTP